MPKDTEIKYAELKSGILYVADFMAKYAAATASINDPSEVKFGRAMLLNSAKGIRAYVEFIESMSDIPITDGKLMEFAEMAVKRMLKPTI